MAYYATYMPNELGELQKVVINAGVGFVLPFYGETAPPGTLACDGSEISRAAYDELFQVLGTKAGAGDGSTTFNIPDLRGYFLRGANGTNSAAIGTAQGDAIRNIRGVLSFITTNYVDSYGRRGCLVIPPSSETNIFYQTPLNDTYAGHGLTGAYDSGSKYPFQHFILDVSRNTPTAAEVRPVNVALLWCIIYE